MSIVRTGFRQGFFSAYRFSNPSSKNPAPSSDSSVNSDTERGAIDDGTYLFASTRRFFISKKSADGLSLPVIPTQILETLFSGSHFGRDYSDLRRVTLVDRTTRDNTTPPEGWTYYELVLAEPGVIFSPTDEDVTVTFNPYGVQPNTSLIEGTYLDNILCNVSQLTRSLDEHYTERYQVVTNHKFGYEDRRNLYAFPLAGIDSGLPIGWVGSKVERLQVYPQFSSLVLQTFPDITLDPFLDFERIEYTIGDTKFTAEVPRVIGTA